jgi:hypothetical protein
MKAVYLKCQEPLTCLHSITSQKVESSKRKLQSKAYGNKWASFNIADFSQATFDCSEFMQPVAQEASITTTCCEFSKPFVLAVGMLCGSHGF